MRKDPKIGDVLIGDFKILDIFGGEGKSGMGVVYLVSSRKYPDKFVIKTFQKDKLASMYRFQQEAENWIQIGIHPNIVQALFVENINNQLFIGAEYICPDDNNRNTITDFLKSKNVSIYNSIRWTAQFCYGMDYAIKKGMKVHRDIKPDNLMIDRFGNLKITDFGISRVIEDRNNFNQERNLIDKIKILLRQNNAPNSRLTETGSFLGTILYSSPEQIFDSSKIDYRSDLYSFGIVLYQLITSGEYPYSLENKSTIDDLALMHLNDSVIEIDHPLSNLVYKCLERKPEDRYSSLNLLLNDLKEIAEKLGLSLPPNVNPPARKYQELYLKSYSYVALDKLADAKRYIDEYLEYDENNSSAWNLKGNIELRLNKLDESLKATLFSYECDPYNSHTCNNLGIIYKRKSNFQKSIDFFLKAIEIDPQNSGAIANLGIAYEALGNFSKSGDCILKALHLAPDKKDLHFTAGNIAASILKNGLPEKAIEILEKLVKIDEHNITNWFNLGLNYQFLNRKEAAIKCYKIVEQTSPEDTKILSFIVKLSAELGDYREAISYCDKLLLVNPSFLKAASWKAQFLQMLGRGQEAIGYLNSQIIEYPNSDELFLTLSSLYSQEDDQENAIKMVVKAKNIVLKNEGNNKEKILYLRNLFDRYQKLKKV